MSSSETTACLVLVGDAVESLPCMSQVCFSWMCFLEWVLVTLHPLPRAPAAPVTAQPLVPLSSPPPPAHNLGTHRFPYTLPTCIHLHVDSKTHEHPSWITDISTHILLPQTPDASPCCAHMPWGLGEPCTHLKSNQPRELTPVPTGTQPPLCPSVPWVGGGERHKTDKPLAAPQAE